MEKNISILCTDRKCCFPCASTWKMTFGQWTGWKCFFPCLSTWKITFPACTLVGKFLHKCEISLKNQEMTCSSLGTIKYPIHLTQTVRILHSAINWTIQMIKKGPGNFREFSGKFPKKNSGNGKFFPAGNS